ncbi:hypothetical protein OIU77_002501 [Salix suchowensis]|uniref:Uncharacterized protein n=1 Tax=Salix suchowensis TaxID=1278906 RepID=A0ABQ9AY60_9ROSI|nr:hypothetical protein OIU77_002501 [Salix suchowensis]
MFTDYFDCDINSKQNIIYQQTTLNVKANPFNFML